MTYTNDIPPNTMFRMTGAPVRAAVEASLPNDSTLLDQQVEVTLPYRLRPEFGFAGMTVPFKKLLRLLLDEGAALSRDRDLTLRHEARDQRMIEEGRFYDRRLYAVLPPQAREELKLDEFCFDTGYVMHLVADDIADSDPERAARFRYVADKYYAVTDDAEPSEEELDEAISRIEEMISELDAAPGMLIRTGKK